MALAKIQVEMYRCDAHILNVYAKEKEKNTTNQPTLLGILLKIKSKYLFSNSLIQLVIQSYSGNACCYFIR